MRHKNKHKLNSNSIDDLDTSLQNNFGCQNMSKHPPQKLVANINRTSIKFLPQIKLFWGRNIVIGQRIYIDRIHIFLKKNIYIYYTYQNSRICAMSLGQYIIVKV